jgi:hypothetical protein
MSVAGRSSQRSSATKASSSLEDSASRSSTGVPSASTSNRTCGCALRSAAPSSGSTSVRSEFSSHASASCGACAFHELGGTRTYAIRRGRRDEPQYGDGGGESISADVEAAEAGWGLGGEAVPERVDCGGAPCCEEDNACRRALDREKAASRRSPSSDEPDDSKDSSPDSSYSEEECFGRERMRDAPGGERREDSEAGFRLIRHSLPDLLQYTHLGFRGR